MKRIKVLIVDDSAVVRQTVSSLLARDPQIEVMGSAADPLFAIERMRRQWPDVIVLDVEMPRMDGITFLRKIMDERPTPVVICSSLTERGAETTLQALAAGAVEIVTKPRVGVRAYLEEGAGQLIQAVKGAGQARLQRRSNPAPGQCPPPKLTADAVLQGRASRAMAATTDRVVAIGTSTGGTQALETVLSGLPPVCPGLLVVQHMPERFTAAFAERLDRICDIRVREAKTGDRVVAGQALLAPGGRHMLLKRNGAQYQVEVVDGPQVSRHRPSVDVLFRSVARYAGRNALGVIMTGMGDDGARGLREMFEAGAYTVAQDEQSCVVFGMPKEAIRSGGVLDVVPLGGIGRVILEFGAGHRTRQDAGGRPGTAPATIPD